ncbi:aldo/keto reductase [Labedaea rhizosphaerae]|uniref:2,5-diketo-D-gluconate reductase A n=1 Tax=Labedaea rhizosphaerae TaxID=598644 RepID=A0A4R6RYF3_LABRH|nr:aldo/keto reductase [Labedaea rhizosphaerae]TDP91963.1 2,5-diketo-D-gluconate reductase A [Labedaea rhizosphaerae]
MSAMPKITLNDGTTIPQLGFGVFQVPADEVAGVVTKALETGYRSIDTAAAYRNEKGVGQALRDSGIAREDLYVTTKLWNDDQGYDSTMRAFDASMAKLGLDYVDLYLIHWPAPGADKYVETWRAFEKLRAEGRVRSIGVSNFQPSHLNRLFEDTGTVPAVNQVELHPRLQQADLRAVHAEHGIATEAWSPLGQGELIRDESIGTLARKYGRTPAQVILRWHLQLGTIVIPKSATPARIEENFQVFDFELAEDDMAAIGDLEAGKRFGPNPDEFGA